MSWIENLKELSRAATPGPWTFRFWEQIGDVLPSGWHLESERIETLADLGDADSAERDAALIATLGSCRDELIAVVEEMEDFAQWANPPADYSGRDVCELIREKANAALAPLEAKLEEGKR